MVMNEEIQIWMEAAKASPHIFSHEFEADIQELIARQKQNKESAKPNRAINKYQCEMTQVRTHGNIIRRAIAVVLAAILILASTIGAIAIVKPEIYYTIVDKITHWIITPGQDEEGEVKRELIPKKTEVPSGYVLVYEEDDDELCYTRKYEDDNGRVLRYSQYLPNDISVSIDSEGISTEKTIINGHSVVITLHDDNSTTVVIEDGDYVYVISGDSHKAVLEMTDRICN